MSYPEDKDIKEHKDILFSRLLQYFKGVVPLGSVDDALRALAGDAALWVHNSEKLDLDKVRAAMQQMTIIYSFHDRSEKNVDWKKKQ
jgi:hypothetical protein